jgi:hypothetical protein
VNLLDRRMVWLDPPPWLSTWRDLRRELASSPEPDLRSMFAPMFDFAVIVDDDDNRQRLVRDLRSF